MELRFYSPDEQEKTVIHTKNWWVEYSNGERHVDIQCGNMAYILGYGNQTLIDAVSKNAVNFIRGTTGETADANDQLVQEICAENNWAALNWAVSGSDAVESAVAMNDMYWQSVDPNRTKILSFNLSYHGTTMLAKHLRGLYPSLGRAVVIDSPQWKQSQHQLGQEKLCLTRIKQTLKQNPSIGCLIMETVSWLTGLVPYSKMFWHEVRQICTEHHVLMILDDVAFCWGTNGTMFGYEQYGVQPDICAIGKSLTAGYSPLGAAVCNKKVQSQIKQETWGHGHTWQPNMAGVVAGLAATKQIKSLLHRVPEIEQNLQSIATELGVNYRGTHTYISFDFNREITLAELSNVGKLAASLKGGTSVMVFAPLTADDEYFAELRAGLKRIQLNA